MKIYFAGPLFTLAERHFNSLIGMYLVAAGHKVWLPQDSEPPHKDANTGKNIFLKDKEGVDWADVVVACMDGADPDSGTCWECGYAYGTGKPVIVFRTDFRADGDVPGAPFNLMLVCSATECLNLPWQPLPQVFNAINEALSRLPGLEGRNRRNASSRST